MILHDHRGFSLVELSIVLVILGLLVGGVLSGQSLIQAAELRSVMRDANDYQVAVNSFKSKYFQLPGDINNATSFWPTTCLDHAGSLQTCNGNADGMVNMVGSNFESARFWQHIGLAGLVTGSYMAINNGSDDLATGLTAVGYAPRSRIANAYFIPDVDPVTSTVSPARTTLGAQAFIMYFGALTDDSTGSGGVLKPEDAYNIDTKSDDGKPLLGKVQAANGKDTTFTTITPTCINVADYRLNDSTKSCALVFPY